MFNLPVEIWDQLVLVPITQVVEKLLMLAKEADVIGGRERLFRKARDGFHHFILVDMYPEVSPIFCITSYYFQTLVAGGVCVREIRKKKTLETFLDFGNFIIAIYFSYITYRLHLISHHK